MSEKYNPKIIEKKWQSYWSENKLFESKVIKDKEKYYILEMFPYPSGKIHMGHVRNYTLGDVIARFKRAMGFNVMHPMGWDAFGLPAENAAIENNTSPKTWTYENISTMKNQLKQMGLSLDWSRELATCDEIYYHQQQKLFLKFYNDNLIYKKESLVNWDPIENTVLANEQVIDGKGWRSGADIEQKNLFTEINRKFEYIIISDTMGYLIDIETTLEKLHKLCNIDTRIIIAHYSPFWEPILNFAARLKLKMPEPL